MPRITELVGFGLRVADAELMDTDERGMIVHDAAGRPRTVPGKQLILLDPATGEQLRLTLNDEERRALVGELTGVEIAQPGAMKLQ